MRRSSEQAFTKRLAIVFNGQTNAWNSKHIGAYAISVCLVLKSVHFIRNFTRHVPFHLSIPFQSAVIRDCSVAIKNVLDSGQRHEFFSRHFIHLNA